MSSVIREHMGDDWDNLHSNIQKRFAHDPQEGEVIHYWGKIDTVRSCAGWLFAHITCLVGNPLTPYHGKDVPLDVRLFRKGATEGICWERTYHFTGKKPYVVTSIKKTGKAGEMLECVGGGFGMVLDVYAQDQQLHFKSTRYFWQCRLLRVYLPHIITPGQTHVIHADIGEGNFRFTISMTHLWLGRTFFQDGIFRRKGE